jgi:hypothetical protein
MICFFLTHAQKFKGPTWKKVVTQTSLVQFKSRRLQITEEMEEKDTAAVKRTYKEKGYNILFSGFSREVDEICAVLGYYAALCGNCLPTFRDNLSSHLQGSRFRAVILIKV